MNKLLLIMAILLFFSINAFAEDCETGLDAYQKYGLDRVLLDWDFESINESTCEHKFCDSVQFSLFAAKHTKNFEEVAEAFLADLNKDELNRIPESFSSSSDLIDSIGFSADTNVFLLESEFTDYFKEDFDYTFSQGFVAGRTLSIRDWNFKNYPKEPGFYNAEIFFSGSVYRNGTDLDFPENLEIEFTLKKTLGEIEEETNTEILINPLLRIPFNVIFSDGERDYGATIKDGAIQLNESELFMQPSGPIADVKVYSRDDFSGVRGGVVLSIDGNAPLGAPYLFSLRPSIPVVFEAHLSKEGENRFYYTLVDSLGNPINEEEFGSFQSLLRWETGEEKIFDYFAEQAPERISCSGWNSNNPLISAKMVLNTTENTPLELVNPLISRDTFPYRAITFLPFDSAISIQCVSDEIDFVMQSYNGEFFGNQKMVSPQPNQFLGGGDSVLEPVSWNDKFSVKDVLSEVKEGRMCVFAHDMGMTFSWNEKAFTDENKKIPDLCRLTKGDASNILDPVYGEEKFRILNREFENKTENTYWCKPREECASEAGYMFSGKTYDPCEGEDYYCCFQESLETEFDCTETEMSLEFDYGEYGTPSAEFIEKLLKLRDSPALEEDDFEEMTLPDALTHFNSLGWEFELGNGETFVKEKDFDPLISLAVFAYESNMGTHPNYDQRRKSIGNIEEKEGEEGELEKPFCTNPTFDRFCGYNEWWESARHLSWRLEYKYYNKGMTTVDSIIPVYAPAPENYPEEYIANVKQNVCRWRQLWFEYKESDVEEEAMASFNLPKIIQKYIKPPKWFTDAIPKINSFITNKVMFWNADSDGDRIPDLKDKCADEKETFNDYKDDDGCPDIQEKREYLRTANISSGNRAIQMSSVPNSISGKKVILFIPSDFDYSESSSFMRLSREYFDDFLSRAGFGSNHGIVFIADNIREYKDIPSCRRVRTSLASSKLLVEANREISNYLLFFKDSEECARDYLRSKYGTVPVYSNYRVVTLIDTEKGVFYNSLFGGWSVGGLANLGSRNALNRVFSIRKSATVSHELGHTFGFGEQYGAVPYLKAYRTYITNYYPGPMQNYHNFSDYPRSAMSLYSRYPRGTKIYPKCFTEFPDNFTNCPEGTIGLLVAVGGIDCDGRYTAKNRTDTRSPMGSSSSRYKRVFDCYEQTAIQAQWG